MPKAQSQPKNWQRMKFKDFADTSPSVKLERGKEYPFIPIDVVDGQHKFPLEVKRKSFSGGGAKFANGDIIFARITPCLENGKIAMVKGLEEGIGFGSTEFFVFRGEDGVSDSDFVYYLSRTDTIRDPAVKSMVGASGRQRADKTVVDNVQIAAPDLPQQKQIAEILSTYDNLIENNTKRIKILEEMAQAIYKEWFVYFRFPGHEKIKMIDSKTEFGKIPEGWEVKKVKDFVDFVRGVETGSKNYQEQSKDGLLPFLRVGDLGARQSNIFIEKELANNKVLSKSNIAVSMDGTVGIVRIGLEGAYSSGIRKVVTKEEKKEFMNNPFVWELMQSENIQNTIQENAKGTTILHASESINNMVFVLPTKEIMKEFFDTAQPTMELIIDLMVQNENLRQARDLLLPKLVGGEITVKR